MGSSGIKAAWERLKELDPKGVSKNAGVSYENSSYILHSFGMDFLINPSEELLKAATPQGEILINRFGYFFNHFALWWLVHAKGIPPTGRLVKPTGLRGGDMFFRGTHTLPLERLAERYNRDKKGFLIKGETLGGKVREFGDASVELWPLPGFPMVLILYLGDEEFSAGAEILFDQKVELELPLDLIWSGAMLSILLFL